MGLQYFPHEAISQVKCSLYLFYILCKLWLWHFHACTRVRSASSRRYITSVWQISWIVVNFNISL